MSTQYLHVHIYVNNCYKKFFENNNFKTTYHMRFCRNSVKIINVSITVSITISIFFYNIQCARGWAIFRAIVRSLRADLAFLVARYRICQNAVMIVKSASTADHDVVLIYL